MCDKWKCSKISKENRGLIFREFEVHMPHTGSRKVCQTGHTESAGNVCGENAREGYIKATLYSRSKMPKFEQKFYFKTKIL